MVYSTYTFSLFALKHSVIFFLMLLFMFKGKWILVSKSLIFVSSGAIIFPFPPGLNSNMCSWCVWVWALSTIRWWWQKTITKEKFMYIFHLNENSTVLKSLKPPFIVICHYAYLHFLSPAIFLFFDFYRYAYMYLLYVKASFSFILSVHQSRSG